MPETETFGSFLKENKKLAQEYIDTRLDIYRLQLIRASSKVTGYLMWMAISLVLIALFIVFAGIVTGFWLSELTGSHIKGFGLTTILILFVFGILALLRRQLFINPIIRAVINRSLDNQKGPEKENGNEKNH
jgi:hypothetical protein